MVGMGNRNLDGSQSGAVGDGAMDEEDMDNDGAFDDEMDAERINDDADTEENLGAVEEDEESDYSDSELTEDAIGAVLSVPWILPSHPRLCHDV
jgi:hypothetical protein